MTVEAEADDNDEHGSFWAHLPGIVLEEGVTARIGAAVIANLSFDEWYALDGEYREPVDYGDTRPAFLRGEVKAGDDSTEATEKARRLIADVYRALLLSTRLPLPPAQMSCAYIPKWSRTLPGACGREWIIGGYWKPIRFNLDIAALDQAAEAYDLLTETRELWAETEIDAAINVLVLSAYPDVTIDGDKINWMNQFVHCIAAAERLLIPDDARSSKGFNITATLGRNAALLDGCAFDAVKERAKFYSDLYRLRSRIIHGEIGAHNIGADEDKLIYGRNFLCTLIVKAIACLRESKDPRPLTEVLKQASQDAASHEALLRQIKRGLKE